MGFETLADLIPYGKFTVKFDVRKDIFAVFKKNKIVFKTKSKNKAIRKAIKLDKKSKRKKNWRKI